MARSSVEQIKERLSILDVVGGYVELKRAGKSYKGKSPFTNEKTPSFYVSPDRGMYYCFSSQRGGDIFTFIQEMEGVDFKGALKILAERAHVELVPEDPKKRSERDTQYTLLEEATQYFFKAREAHPHVNEYIERRGVTTQTIHSWRIGYSKDGWRELKHHLKEKGYTEEEMFRAGLIKKADAGKEAYDAFRDRIMFPIMDASGRVVAFSGRTLKTESGIPKYVNSAESELFQKSEILYGYDKAKNGIRQYDFSLIVEGQFDLVLTHQAGYTNTVAVSGTALTSHHIMLLLRLTKNAVLALDADRAGIAAVKRSAFPMLYRGMDVKVAHMPSGLDPADLIRENPKKFKEIVGGAKHVIEFLLAILKASTKDSRTYKLRVREEILPLLVAIDNRIDREHFEGVIAEHIDSTKEGIHFEVERLLELRKHEEENIPQPSEERIEKEKMTPHKRRENIERHLYSYLSVLSHDSEWIGKEIRLHIERILTEDEATEFFDAYKEIDTARDIFMLEEQIATISERQLLEDVSHALTLFSHLVARERLNRLRDLLKTAEHEVDEDKTFQILKETKNAELLLKSKIKIQKE